MPKPFEQLQQRVNNAEISHLSNKTFVINGLSVDGVFDNEFINVGIVESQAPVFECRESDMGIVTHGMVITSDSINYKIRSVQPDGTGMTRLILEKQ